METIDLKDMSKTDNNNPPKILEDNGSEDSEILDNLGQEESTTSLTG
jgi:hypothetical protein